MVIICRIDLDKFDLLSLSKFYAEGIVTMGEIAESKAYKEMSELHQLLWTRQVQDLRKIAN